MDSKIELTTKQRSKARRALKALMDIRDEVQEANPDNEVFWYYEGDGNFHLMDGPTHLGMDGIPNFDGIIETIPVIHFDGGGW